MRPARQIYQQIRPKVRAAIWLAITGALVCAVGCTGNVKPNSSATVQTPGLPTGQTTFAISGTVAPVLSATTTLSLSGASTATTTASNTGSYTFSGLSAGTYAVTPSSSGFGFNPTTQVATISTNDVTGVNFTSKAQTGPTFTLSGTISPASAGSGAAVVLSGPVGATATANSSGTYSFPGLSTGTYSVTPSKSGFTFSPTAQTATVTSANLTGVNFTGTAASQQTHNVSLNWTASSSTVAGYNVYRSTVSGSGYVKINTSLINALTFSDDSVSSGTTYFYVATSVDSGGDESSDSNQAVAVIP
jgi:hypothetical protein